MSEEAEKLSATPAEPVPAPVPAPQTAWQPFTFGGVAAFARASYGRLLVVQIAAALLFAGSAVWFLGHCYAPVITLAIQQLPEGAALTNGQLTGLPVAQISETKFLSIALAPDEDTDLDQSADLQIVARKVHIDVSSLLSSALGSVTFDFNPHSNVDLSRSRLEPLWGAWEPVFLAGAGLAVILALLLIWAVLAWIYAPAAKLMAWLCDRELSWPAAWRLASAALLPGAILLAAGVLLYGWQVVDVFGLGWFETVHLLVGWVYLLAAPFFVPPRGAVKMPAANPFTA